MEENHSRVVAPPPLIYGFAFLVGAVIRSAVPIRSFTSWGFSFLGVGLIVLGGALALWALAQFRKAGTSVDPAKPVRNLVRDGPYRWSRNPLYLALTLVSVGVSMRINWFWTLVMLVPVLWIMSWGVIAREERYLEDRFDDTYRAYKRRVRRWI